MRKYGGLYFQLPIQYISVLIGSLALIGTPYLTGFYSKDAIPEVLLGIDNFSSFWGFWISLVASLLTVSYSVKIIYWTFFSQTYYGVKNILINIHRISSLEILVLCCLSLFSIFIGFITRDRFIGLGGLYLSPALKYSNIYSDSEFLSAWYKVLIMLCLFGGLILGYVFISSWGWVQYNMLVIEKWFTLCYYSRFLICKWYFDMFINQYIAYPILNFGYKSFWVWDKWILEQGRLAYLKAMFK